MDERAGTGSTTERHGDSRLRRGSGLIDRSWRYADRLFRSFGMTRSEGSLTFVEGDGRRARHSRCAGRAGAARAPAFAGAGQIFLHTFRKSADLFLRGCAMYSARRPYRVSAGCTRAASRAQPKERSRLNMPPASSLAGDATAGTRWALPCRPRRPAPCSPAWRATAEPSPPFTAAPGRGARYCRAQPGERWPLTGVRSETDAPSPPKSRCSAKGWGLVGCEAEAVAGPEGDRGSPDDEVARDAAEHP